MIKVRSTSIWTRIGGTVEENDSMQITYLEHSGYFVELSSHCLLFDYVRGTLPLVKHKPLYVFVSHAHEDHYQASIFDLSMQYEKVTYILSDDIEQSLSMDCLRVKGDETYQIDDVEIRTLVSTDQGVAFCVSVEEICIYHAGDLHWWHWEEENSDQENEEAKAAYLTQLDKLAQYQFDVAFVVVDPRQEDQFAYGIDAFMKHCHAKAVFPMHMWGDYEIIKELKALPETKAYRDRIMEIHHAQEEFII